MCGRYYVDDDTAKEIEKLIRQADENVKMRKGKQDIGPAQSAFIYMKEKEELAAELCFWGFPGINGKGLLINARCETALEKSIFRDRVRRRRCVVPAKGFYEWDRNKDKAAFQRGDDRMLYMAGFYDWFGEEKRFVILTTAANESVSGVHERMPLVLEEDEWREWLREDGRTEAYLKKKPVQLQKIQKYQQQVLDLTR